MNNKKGRKNRITFAATLTVMAAVILSAGFLHVSAATRQSTFSNIEFYSPAKYSAQDGSNGYIAKGDLGVIESVWIEHDENGWSRISTTMFVTYPTSKGKVSRPISAPGFFEQFYEVYPKQTIQLYKTSDLKTKYRTAWTSDKCYVIQERGNLVFVMMPLDKGGYAIGWSYASNFSRTKSASAKEEKAKTPAEQLVDFVLPNGYYTISIEGYYADIAGGSSSNAAALQLWNSNGSPAQIFYFHRMPDGSYLIKTVCSEMSSGETKYLEISGGSQGNGGKVQQWGLDAGSGYFPWKYWYLKKNEATGKIFIINKNSGKAIDVYGANFYAGAPLTQYDLYDVNNIAQGFTITAAFNPGEITKILYLNDTDGAKGFGHSAVLLIDKNGRSAYCSLNQTSVMDIKFSSELTTTSCLISGYFNSDSITGKDYERALEFKISTSKGKEGWSAIVGLYTQGLNYNALLINCDDYAGAILQLCGVTDMSKSGLPNLNYESLKKKKLHTKEYIFS